jgi:hypothetical protein
MNIIISWNAADQAASDALDSVGSGFIHRLLMMIKNSINHKAHCRYARLSYAFQLM